MSASEATAAAAEATKLCFVVAPIGEPGSETRKRSDKVLKHIVVKALEEFRYEVVRADKISKPGVITVQVLEQILTADLVISDLSEHNPNVFYEVAVRHAAGGPIIHMIDSREQIPFDVSDFRTIKFDHTDLDSVEGAIGEIRAQVRGIEAGANAQTPVQLAGFTLSLGSSAVQDKEVFTQLLNNLLEVRQAVLEIKLTTERLEGRPYYSPGMFTLGRPLNLLATPNPLVGTFFNELYEPTSRAVPVSSGGQPRPDEKAAQAASGASAPPPEGGPASEGEPARVRSTLSGLAAAVRRRRLRKPHVGRETKSGPKH